MDVETLAVSKITSLIAVCTGLVPNITANDKTPFTDGHIEVYEGAVQTNEHWQGKVPVQVKGRTRSKNQHKMKTYSVSRVDLVGFQKDGGVLYFVVSRRRDTNDLLAYYALLSPFVIEHLLETASAGKKSISFALKEVPEKPEQLEAIVRLSLKTRDQKPSLGFDASLFEQAQSFTIYTASSMDLESPVTLSPESGDYALVLNTAGGMSIPVAGLLQIFPQSYIAQQVDVVTSSGSVTYSKAMVRQVAENTREARLSSGLALTLTEDTRRLTVHLTPEETLAGRLKAFEFMEAVQTTHEMVINGHPSPLQLTTSVDDTRFNDQLKTLRALNELCEQLGVDTRLINLEEITESELRQLSYMHRAFVDKEEIAGIEAKVGIAVQSIGRWKLLIVVLVGSETGNWTFIDPFAPSTRLHFRRSPEGVGVEDSIPVTAYDAVDPELLPTVLNLRLESIVDAYETIAEMPTTPELANFRILELIRSADDSKERRVELLDAASRLNDWLTALQKDEPRNTINGWQISWRQGSLSSKQRDDIRSFRRSVRVSGSDSPELFQVACALLLEDTDEVHHLIGQLPHHEFKALRGWPIWQLHKEVTVTPKPEAADPHAYRCQGCPESQPQGDRE